MYLLSILNRKIINRICKSSKKVIPFQDIVTSDKMQIPQTTVTTSNRTSISSEFIEIDRNAYMELRNQKKKILEMDNYLHPIYLLSVEEANLYYISSMHRIANNKTISSNEHIRQIGSMVASMRHRYRLIEMYSEELYDLCIAYKPLKNSSGTV